MHIRGRSQSIKVVTESARGRRRTRYGLILVSAACFRAAISATLRFASAIFLASSGSTFGCGRPGTAGMLGLEGSVVGTGGRGGIEADEGGGAAPPLEAAFIAASFAWISARLAAMSMAGPPAGGRGGNPSLSGVGMNEG